MDCIKWLKKINNMMKGSKLLDVKRHFSKGPLTLAPWGQPQDMRKKHKKKKNKLDPYEKLYSDMNGTFAFIAGYTSGGAPYGVTWEQVGID